MHQSVLKTDQGSCVNEPGRARWRLAPEHWCVEPDSTPSRQSGPPAASLSHYYSPSFSESIEASDLKARCYITEALDKMQKKTRF